MSHTTCPRCGSSNIFTIEAWDCEEVGPHYWTHNIYQYTDCLACGRKSPVKGEQNVSQTDSRENRD